jgi:hypothetical protein
MTAEAFAELVGARSVGRHRWMARCPAHPDRSPSLSVAEGHDGRTLVHCWAGCATSDVLKEFGLSMRDLYAGSPPSPSQVRELSIERARRDAEASAARGKGRERTDRVRKLSVLVDALRDHARPNKLRAFSGEAK